MRTIFQRTNQISGRWSRRCRRLDAVDFLSCFDSADSNGRWLRPRWRRCSFYRACKRQTDSECCVCTPDDFFSVTFSRLHSFLSLLQRIFAGKSRQSTTCSNLFTVAERIYSDKTNDRPTGPGTKWKNKRINYNIINWSSLRNAGPKKKEK